MSYIAQSYDSKTYGMMSFFNVTKLVNPSLRWLVDLSIVIKGLGGSVGFLLISGTLFAAIIENLHPTGLAPETLKRLVIIGVVVLLSPVIYAHRLNATRFTNAFGLVSLGYLAVLAIVYAKPSLDSASLWPVSWVGMLARFPVFMFAFMCHHNFFQVAEEMPKVTIRKLNIVSVSAVTTGLVIFLPTMVLPYMTYGPDVGDNFLTSMPVSDVPIKIAYVAAALSVLERADVYLFAPALSSQSDCNHL
ncbi:vacuolar amino acid transporter, putative [Perkinsus marinus ATCC 50983]|uniref:Vacuolar amino acid transporter, putative n=1 Tax=Perkinsus marinus (strain ATCC 50983 / TXsc) TaxID=423536 RepID=C5LEI7_PERM5|nr:vacuolar amino acid transporter, putative [Perkinsus marinus ATCC 50983]EER04805.1 vacuolar amino acid transporter, putative [Perkinsus marinus ATCC 50983]|eukprot:XP_002772989.1 vacuolar amino acid transporter, putative [Perkinsus marinus ATCC 50983]